MRFFKYLFLLLFAAVALQAFSGFTALRVFDHLRKRVAADCPVIDLSKIIIKQPDCDLANGSITGVTVTSTGTKILYTWRNGNNGIVGHSANLLNIPAGTYTLIVTDNSNCPGPILSTSIAVNNKNAITIDDSRILIKNAVCNNQGSIVGINVTGATTYEWKNLTTNTIVSTSTTTAELFNVGPGGYQLNAYNSTCQLTSKTYYITSTIELPKVTDVKITEPICSIGDATGVLSVSLLVPGDLQRMTYVFTDSNGQWLSTGPLSGAEPNPVLSIGQLSGGAYYLYVLDNQNCSALLGAYKLDDGVFEISQSQTKITNDRCNQGLGFIEPVFTGGGTPGRGWTYTWYLDGTTTIVGKSKVLTRVGAGKYKLVVTSDGGCRAIGVFTVANVSPSVIPPIAAGSTVCLPGIINITVSNPDTAAVFRLYDSPISSTPIDSNKNGIFYENVSQTTDFYVTRVHKDCESDRTKVTEVVVVSIKIPNAFTPNNDGVNDTWDIAGIDKFPGADVKIFTRDGKLIFHSVNYPVAFDGTYGGSLVPAGVYYYIIDVKQPICYSKISGSLTIIR